MYNFCSWLTLKKVFHFHLHQFGLYCYKKFELAALSPPFWFVVPWQPYRYCMYFGTFQIITNIPTGGKVIHSTLVHNIFFIIIISHTSLFIEPYTRFIRPGHQLSSWSNIIIFFAVFPSHSGRTMFAFKPLILLGRKKFVSHTLLHIPYWSSKVPWC